MKKLETSETEASKINRGLQGRKAHLGANTSRHVFAPRCALLPYSVNKSCYTVVGSKTKILLKYY